MKNSTFFKCFFFLSFIFLFFSCEREELDFYENVVEEDIGEDLDNDISNGFRRKVENLYTITNMQMALDSITYRMEVGKVKRTSGEKASIPTKGKIAPNMLYIQFTPKTLEEEGLLKKDSTLALIDYPLGYEYEEGFFDNRPKLKEGEIPEYYTTVSVERKLPEGVPHKVLEEMYVPQEDENLEKSRANQYRTSKNGVGDFVDILLHQAFKQTNNEGMDGLGILKGEEGENLSQNKLLGIEIGEKWLPEGILRIWDDNIGSTGSYNKVLVGYEYYDCELAPISPLTSGPDLLTSSIVAPIQQCKRAIYRYDYVDNPGSFVPLKGAQVLLRDTYTIGNAITDSNGYFVFDHKRGEKRYIIQWERYEYSIRNGSLFQAELQGPKKHSRWDYDIKGGDDQYHGLIHLGAHDYYYGSRFGLTSPPTNATLKRQIKIAAREENDKSSYAKARRIWFGADISLQAYGDPSDEVYGTTIHELAHAAHREVDANAYNNIVFDAYTSPCAPSAESCDNPGPTGKNNRRLLETWASTVEIVFVLRRYREEANQSNYHYRDIDYQRRPITSSGNFNSYTSAGYDMIDIINQRDIYGLSYPIDRVSGYTIKQLENALVGAKAWWEWRDNIKTLYSNTTESNLNELFNNWPN